jgi:hypothetical protein
MFQFMLQHSLILGWSIHQIIHQIYEPLNDFSIQSLYFIPDYSRIFTGIQGLEQQWIFHDFAKNSHNVTFLLFLYFAGSISSQYTSQHVSGLVRQSLSFRFRTGGGSGGRHLPGPSFQSFVRNFGRFQRRSFCVVKRWRWKLRYQERRLARCFPLGSRGRIRRSHDLFLDIGFHRVFVIWIHVAINSFLAFFVVVAVVFCRIGFLSGLSGENRCCCSEYKWEMLKKLVSSEKSCKNWTLNSARCPPWDRLPAKPSEKVVVSFYREILQRNCSGAILASS